MNISPREAAQALDAAHRTQHTALRSAPPMFPAWYLTAVWGVVTAIQFATEIVTGVATAVILTVALIALAVSVVKFIRDIRNLSLRPHRSLIDPWAWVGFSIWIIGTMGLTFALLAAFLAVDFPYPRTGCTLVTFVIVMFTAPLLPRWMTMRTARRAEKAQPAAGPNTETAAQ